MYAVCQTQLHAYHVLQHHTPQESAKREIQFLIQDFKTSCEEKIKGSLFGPKELETSEL